MLSAACAELKPAVHQTTYSSLIRGCKFGYTHRHLHAADSTCIGLQTCTSGKCQSMGCDQHRQLKAEVWVHRKHTQRQDAVSASRARPVAGRVAFYWT